jgi:uncharacterized phage-associated protein
MAFMQLSRKIHADKKLKRKIFLYAYWIALEVAVIYLIAWAFQPLIIDLVSCFKQDGLSSCASNFKEYITYYLSGKCYVKPSGPKGTTNQTLVLPVSIYMTYPIDFTEEELNDTIRGLNSVWSEYGIQFSIHEIHKVQTEEKDFIDIQSFSELKKASERIIGEGLYQKGRINIIISDKFRQKENWIIWSKYTTTNIEGRGLRTFNDNSSINLVLLYTDVKNMTWDMSHEFGHVLGLLDKPFFTGEYNLMAHVGCIKDKFYPTLLNQEQVDVVIQTAEGLNQKFK